MSIQIDGSYSVAALSQTAAEIYYPTIASPAGTTTAGSSDFATAGNVILEAIVVEDEGSAAGVLTITDHAQTSGTAIVLNVFPDTAAIIQPRVIQFGPYGVKVPWKGIAVKLTGTAQRVRVIFRTA